MTVKSFVLIIVILMFCQGVYAEVLGTVVRSIYMPEYPAGYIIKKSTEIHTGSRQKIAIKTAQGDMIILGGNATIQLKKPGLFSQLFGKVYYFFNKVKREKFEIHTVNATIGIRGTKFIVNVGKKNQELEKISLVEGHLNLVPNESEYFKLYRQRELSEFERYKRQQLTEFEAYKEQLMDEFIGFKKSIDFSHGNAMVFNGAKVTNKKLDGNISNEIKGFEQFIENILPSKANE